MKQTAVEWLINQIDDMYLHQIYNKEFEQAKEMEKQQIINSMDIAQMTDFYVKYEGSEQYYNETFKKK
jgi:hypothetical protein